MGKRFCPRCRGIVVQGAHFKIVGGDGRTLGTAYLYYCKACGWAGKWDELKKSVKGKRTT